MGFFISLLAIIAIQFIASTILSYFGVPALYIDITINFLLAFIFTYFNFARFAQNKKEVFKNISFHLNFCIWFSVLMGMSIFNVMLMN